ncbi:MAG: DMT family transporter [Alphaproteobacteria bacterium]|nr:DMT family transporter [Alphaproteobacteria bacterium]
MAFVTDAEQTARRERTALAALFFACSLFSFTAVFVRLSEVGPAATGFWRYTFTVPFMIAWIAVLAWRRPTRVLPTRREAASLFAAALMLATNVVTWQEAIIETSIANAVLLANLHPIMVAIGAYYLFGERMAWPFWAGLVFALIGTALLIRAGAGPLTGVNHGDLLALVGAASFGAWVLLAKAQRGSLSTPVTMAWNMGLGAPMLLIYTAIVGEPIMARTAFGWGVLFAFAVTVNVIGLSIFTYTTGRLSASINAAALLVIPVLSTTYGWILFDERVSLTQGIAAALVLAGLFLTQRGQRGR